MDAFRGCEVFAPFAVLLEDPIILGAARLPLSPTLLLPIGVIAVTSDT